ncbi:MAG: KH domain-containing protein [Fusobacteriaceae bacterium]|nr:KH domain-containing protein [Fusobacteriaceae bacterium]MBP6467930.1 KH domain-containing protein [Fusobacteriaceae bacterium]MBP9595561.1 KH domain-containing protein [Fusobacteriaceae bacterium]MBU9917333.1 KH domain-containing protein [Fusobacteriaceae bacterium]
MKKLEDLLRFILSEIVESGQDISIRTIEKADTIILKVKVADGELGKVIGKNGLTANAIRGVMQAAGVKDKLNVNVEFVD